MSDTKITTHAISSGSILRIILILVLFYGLFIIKNIILTLLTAIIIASAIEPGAAWLEKRKIPRTIAVLMIYVAVFLFFGGLFAFFMPMLFKEVVNMLNVLPEYIDTIIQSSTSKGFEGIAPLFSE